VCVSTSGRCCYVQFAPGLWSFDVLAQPCSAVVIVCSFYCPRRFRSPNNGHDSNNSTATKLRQIATASTSTCAKQRRLVQSLQYDYHFQLFKRCSTSCWATSGGKYTSLRISEYTQTVHNGYFV